MNSWEIEMNNITQLDVSKVPKELIFLLDVIKMENITDIAEKYKKSLDQMDWDHILKLVLHHRLYPLLYSKISVLEKMRIPTKVVKTISYYYQKNTFQMLHLCGQMEYVSKLFISNGISPLFLKGPVLATDLYGDISLRTSGDLDVLISIEDLERAEELLIEEGYIKDEYIQTVLNDWKWRHHHFTYFHPKKGIKLEIHWRLNPAPTKEPSFHELWNRKRVSTITKYPVYILGSEDLFFFLVTHGARHGWSRLRWLLDIHMLVQKELHWPGLRNLLHKYKTIHIAGQALLLTCNLLDTEITEEMEPLIKSNRSQLLAQQAIFYSERMINLHTEPVPHDISKYHSRHLFSLMSIQQKIMFILSTLHPYYMDKETLPLPKKLHFLYFPLRPFLLMWRRGSRQV
ncbi:nucleotidyltransferase domain-containing protein [Bacillus timonensis]|uniref:nucleotidyltransferase domain-containing protein n=1 Tax=Bacillus timonensis TaxID=1033734 RepID=UPI000288B283|nr:nucleotidyltransferase family protein [Bacillus timonensis]